MHVLRYKEKKIAQFGPGWTKWHREQHKGKSKGRAAVENRGPIDLGTLEAEPEAQGADSQIAPAGILQIAMQMQQQGLQSLQTIMTNVMQQLGNQQAEHNRENRALVEAILSRLPPAGGSTPAYMQPPPGNWGPSQWAPQPHVAQQAHQSHAAPQAPQGQTPPWTPLHEPPGLQTQTHVSQGGGHIHTSVVGDADGDVHGDAAWGAGNGGPAYGDGEGEGYGDGEGPGDGAGEYFDWTVDYGPDWGKYDKESSLHAGHEVLPHSIGYGALHAHVCVQGALMRVSLILQSPKRYMCQCTYMRLAVSMHETESLIA